MNTLIKLLPCPFCGGKAKCQTSESGYYGYCTVFCQKCDAQVSNKNPLHIHFIGKCEEFRAWRNKAREKWNKRTSPMASVSPKDEHEN